jgi:hypothetical protein
MSSEASASETTCQRAVPQPGGKSGVDNEDLSELPFHVQSFREGLLDFIHFLGLQSTMLVAGADDDDFIPLSAYKPDGMTESQRAREREFMEGIQNLVNGARSAKNCGEWKTLIQKRLTHGMESAHNFGYVDEGGTREALLMESLVVQLCIPALHGECILNILSSERLITLNRADIGFWRAIPDPPKHPSHQPSPSLYFGFPIHKIDGANQKTAKGFQKDSSFNNYTLENFAKLSMNGLQCVPFARFPRVAEDPSVCFPWAIVQVLSTFTCDEPNDASFTHMVSEASAAASIALSMFERLAKFADEKQDGQHIPPVVVITSVGAKTIVWLAYCEIVDDRLRDHVRTLLLSFLQSV